MRYIYTSPGARSVRIAVRFPESLTLMAVKNPNIELGLIEYRDVDLSLRENIDRTLRWVGYDQEGDVLHRG